MCEMPKYKDVDWRGPQVRRAVQRASKRAIDDTMSRAVRDAKNNVPVVTSTLQGSLRIEPAEIKGNVVSGRWGSFDVNYALAVEMGNPSLVPAGGDVKRDTLPNTGRGIRTGNTGFLRGAAEKEYRNLAKRIRDEFESKLVRIDNDLSVALARVAGKVCRLKVIELTVLAWNDVVNLRREVVACQRPSTQRGKPHVVGR